MLIIIKFFMNECVVQSQTQKEKAGHVFTWFCLPVNQSPDFY